MRRLNNCIALAVLVFATIGAAPSANDWTMARKSPDLNAVANSLVQELQWRTPLTDGTNSTPVIGDNKVFVDGNGHVLWTLDLYTGKVLWQSLAGNELSGVPLLYHGRVIVSQGKPGGAGENGIAALDAATGDQLWYQPLSGSGTPTPAIVDGVLINHDSGGTVEAYDPNSGNQLWERQIQTHAHASAITPIGNANFVTAGDDPDEVLAMNARKKNVLWKTAFPHNARSVGSSYLAFDGARVFGGYFLPSQATSAAQYKAQQRLYAIDAKNGRMVWTTTVATGTVNERFLTNMPLLIGETIFTGSPLTPRFAAYNAKTGARLWSTTLDAPASHGSVGKAGVIYVPTQSGTIYAIDGKTGKMLGHQRMPDVFTDTSPAIAGDSLIIGGNHGYVFAIPLKELRGDGASH
ncbi:MAG TPA: PQQ-binding-like beta-propeller repeat protein [Candidatus Aquilonibacter sp.]|nr:PQQ-binding-like beta-propeller repeat protein [Candidatus Aquilonibacter sp.]